MAEMKDRWNGDNAERIRHMCAQRVMEVANPCDPTAWNRFLGKTRLHRYINAYLCREFYVINDGDLITLDQCLVEANTIMEIVEAETARAHVYDWLCIAGAMCGAALLGWWAGVNW